MCEPFLGDGMGRDEIVSFKRLKAPLGTGKSPKTAHNRSVERPRSLLDRTFKRSLQFFSTHSRDSRWKLIIFDTGNATGWLGHATLLLAYK